MAKKKSPTITVPVPALKPIIRPVVERLEKHEDLLLEMKSALDVQFQRIAAIQAQLDHMIATIRARS